MKIFLISTCFILLVGCGKEISDKSKSELASPLAANVCKVSVKDYSGCCSSHGGAKSCGYQRFEFSISDGLICTDGSTSPSCVF